MTIASQTSRIAYTGDGVTTAFAVPFFFSANSDLVVSVQDLAGNVTTKLLGTDYNLTGATLSGGGTCTFVTAPTTGFLIAITRVPPITQTTSYNNNDPFPAKSHEGALDKITTIAQYLKSLIDRALLVAPTDNPPMSTLPPASVRALKNLSFDSLGNPSVSTPVVGTTVSAAMIPVVTASTLGVAMTALGLGSMATQSAGAVAITGGTVFADVGVAWKVANLRADNTPGFVTVGMDLTADYAILYNPVTGSTKRIVGSALTKTCNISSAGPITGGRDQAAAFVSGNVVWFYYIWGSVPGVGSTTSLTAPVATNGGGTTGPVLPAGYTHYAPCFPLPLVGSATLNPLLPQGGSSQFQVRGNTVSYPNIPELIGAGFPTMAFNVSTWAPPSVALLTNIMIDVEIHSSAGGPVIGGAVPSTSLGNFGNISLYPPVASSWSAQDPTYSLPLPGGLMTITFLSSSGVIDNALGEVWIRGYTFSNGD